MITFDQFKEQAIANMASTEPCDTYQMMLKSTSYRSLIRSGCGVLAWVYLTGIITDSMLDSVPESDLNVFGIYTGTVSLTNPDYPEGCHDFTIDDEEGPNPVQELFFLKTANITFVVNSGEKYRIYILGNAQANITASNNSSVSIYAHNSAQVTAEISGDGILDISTFNSATSNVSASDDVKVYIKTSGNSIMQYLGANNTVAVAKLHVRSILQYALTESAIINILKFNKATTTTFLP